MRKSHQKNPAWVARKAIKARRRRTRIANGRSGGGTSSSGPMLTWSSQPYTSLRQQAKKLAAARAKPLAVMEDFSFKKWDGGYRMCHRETNHEMAFIAKSANSEWHLLTVDSAPVGTSHKTRTLAAQAALTIYNAR